MFKVGDKVIVTNPYSPLKGLIGEIVSINPLSPVYLYRVNLSVPVESNENRNMWIDRLYAFSENEIAISKENN